MLSAAPFFPWLGVSPPSDRKTDSFTLLESLRRLGAQHLLGPGMSVLPLLVLGGLGVVLGMRLAGRGGTGSAVVGILVGAAAGAFSAYLHAALEYTGSAIARLGSVQAPTTPGFGLGLALLGSAALLVGGVLPLTQAAASVASGRAPRRRAGA